MDRERERDDGTGSTVDREREMTAQADCGQRERDDGTGSTVDREREMTAQAVLWTERERDDGTGSTVEDPAVHN